MNDILYIKTDRNIEVDHIDVTLGDVAKLECSNASVKNRLKTLKILKIQADKSNRYIFSVLKVIELIHEIYPNLEIQSLGEPDFIVEYESPACLLYTSPALHSVRSRCRQAKATRERIITIIR